MSIFKTMTGTGKDIVLIHGSSVNHEDMQPVIDALSLHYKVTSIDLPGMGHSKWNPHIQTIHDIADLVLPELPENAIYIGWSFGGLVALSIGARYPKRMKRFIGIGTTPNFMADDNWIGLPKPGYAALVASIFEKKSFHTFVKEFYEQEFTNTNQTKSPLYLAAQKICARYAFKKPHLLSLRA